MNIICFASEKGGSSKTSCTVGLGAALAKSRKKILLIDMDSQGSLTHHLSMEHDKLSGTIVDILEKRKSFESAITQCNKNLHFIASHRKLAEWVDQDFRESFTDILNEAKKIYDYIFIDFPPMFSDFTVVLLSVADQVIIPVEGRGGLSIRGLYSQIETIQLVQNNLNADLELTGIIACRMVNRMKLCQEVHQYIHKNFKGIAYKNTVRESIKVAEAGSLGKTIFSHSPKSNPAQDFQMIAKEFLQKQRYFRRKKRKGA